MTAALQGENDAVLLRRRDTGEHRRLFRQMSEDGIVDPRDVITARDLLIVQRDVPADVVRDELVVARENLHGRAVALEFRQYISDVRQDRIGEADEAGQHEIGLIVPRVRVARRQPAIRDRQHAQTVGAQPLVDGGACPSRRGVERGHPPLGFDCRGQADDRFGCTLGNQKSATATVWRVHDDRQTPTVEIEGNLVDFLIAGDVGRSLLKNRGIERAADPRLESTVDIGERQGSRRSRADWIHGTFEVHDSGGQRPGLVAAQDVDTAEVLNGRQMFDNHLVARHPERALRQRNRADHRQELRREPDA